MGAMQTKKLLGTISIIVNFEKKKIKKSNYMPDTRATPLLRLNGQRSLIIYAKIVRASPTPLPRLAILVGPSVLPHHVTTLFHVS